MDKYRTINDITIEEADEAARLNAKDYDIHFQKAARAAFIEGVLWAQKQNRRSCHETR